MAMDAPIPSGFIARGMEDEDMEAPDGRAFRSINLAFFSLLLAVSLAVVDCSVASRWSFYHSYYGEPSGLRINKGSCSWDFLLVVLVQNGRNCESDLRM
jgi:hypothetical protein